MNNRRKRKKRLANNEYWFQKNPSQIEAIEYRWDLEKEFAEAFSKNPEIEIAIEEILKNAKRNLREDCGVGVLG